MTKTMRAMTGGAGALALALALLAAPPTAPAQADPPAPDGRAHVVPLVTGDLVRVDAQGAARFVPGPGRAGIGHLEVNLDGDRYVIPADAREAFADGRLDRRLFDVSLLVREGFADRKELPLIVSGGGTASLAAGGVRLRSIDATASTFDTAGLAALWASASGATSFGEPPRIRLDGRSHVALDVSVPMVGAPAAWRAGYDGTGVTIAVLDTGLDATHPDLAGRVTESRDFTGTTAEDVVGHGTHVASTAAGSGAASGGRYKGVAPGASLLIGKVCDEWGCPESAMIAGMEWAAERGAAVVNMSIGGPAAEGDPVIEALEHISAEKGTLFAVAAGNEGPEGSIGSPGSAPSAITVGSVTKDGRISSFSSRGPGAGYTVKPDIAAPGSGITAARAAGTGGEGPYATHSGTSMAAPHVAGAAALLKQRHPDWTGARLKQALTGAARDLGDLGPYEEGTGLLDIARALDQPVFADGPVAFGRFDFPQDQPTATRTVTYTNDGDAEVTLDVSLTQAAPGFAVDRPQVTIPAHGTASVTVSYDPDPSRPGDHAAELVAAGGTTVVRTSVGASAEGETHALSVPMTFPDGQERGPVDLLYRNLDTGETGWWLVHPFEEPQRRFGPGRYAFAVAAQGLTGPRRFATTIGYTTVDLSADASMPLDLTAARPAVVEVPGTGAEPAGASFGVVLAPGVGVSMPADVLSLLPGGPDSAVTRLTLSAATPTASYVVAQAVAGPLPAGLTLTRAPAELRRVEHVIEGMGGEAVTGSLSLGPAGWYETADAPVTVPGTTVTYLSPGEWDAGLSFADWSVRQTAEITARPGGSTVLRWNRAPLGLSFPTPEAVTLGDGLLYAPVSPFGGPDPAMPARSSLTEGRLTLDVNGARVLDAAAYDENRFAVEGELTGDCVLRIEGSRDVPWSAIGTASSAEFRWRDGEGPAGIIAARVDATGVRDGYAAAALPQLVAVTVGHNRADPAATASLGLDVSYDEGRTWRRVRLVRAGESAFAVLVHPAGATSVSTRLAATDTAGSSSLVTTIRSYGLR